MKKNEILKLTLCAVMASVSIVLERFVSLDLGMGLKLTFYGFPLMVVGVMFGIKMGLVTGLVAGVIIQLTSPYGVSITSIFWVLAPLAWGVVSAIAYFLLKKKNGIFIFIIVAFVTSLSATLINTVAMILEGLILGDEYYAFANVMTKLPVRLLSMLILVIPYGFLLESISKIKLDKN